MKKMHLWVAVFLAGMLLVACGQKGPLVLPDTPKHKKVTTGPRPPAAPAPPAPAPPAIGAPAPAPPATDTPATDTRTPPDAPQRL